MQSVVGMLVFGGHGLGLYGHWSRVALFVAPFVFWSLQVVLAWAWTSRFRVGPLEALWRGLSRGDFSFGARAGGAIIAPRRANGPRRRRAARSGAAPSP